MNKKDIAIGAGILLVLLGAFFLLRRSDNENTDVPAATPTSSVEQKIESAFKVDIPDDVDKAELKGDGGSGIATKKFENGKFNATILADLPDSQVPYKAEIRKADDDKQIISLGNLRVAKGGYMVEFQANQDLSEYKKVLILGEDSKVVLEGSFN